MCLDVPERSSSANMGFQSSLSPFKFGQTIKSVQVY